MPVQAISCRILPGAHWALLYVIAFTFVLTFIMFETGGSFSSEGRHTLWTLLCSLMVFVLTVRGPWGNTLLYPAIPLAPCYTLIVARSWHCVASYAMSQVHTPHAGVMAMLRTLGPGRCMPLVRSMLPPGEECMIWRQHNRRHQPSNEHLNPAERYPA